MAKEWTRWSRKISKFFFQRSQFRPPDETAKKKFSQENRIMAMYNDAAYNGPGTEFVGVYLKIKKPISRSVLEVSDLCLI